MAHPRLQLLLIVRGGRLCWSPGIWRRCHDVQPSARRSAFRRRRPGNLRRTARGAVRQSSGPLRSRPAAATRAPSRPLGSCSGTKPSRTTRRGPGVQRIGAGPRRRADPELDDETVRQPQPAFGDRTEALSTRISSGCGPNTVNHAVDPSSRTASVDSTTRSTSESARPAPRAHDPASPTATIPGTSSGEALRAVDRRRDVTGQLAGAARSGTTTSCHVRRRSHARDSRRGCEIGQVEPRPRRRRAAARPRAPRRRRGRAPARSGCRSRPARRTRRSPADARSNPTTGERSADEVAQPGPLRADVPDVERGRGVDRLDRPGDLQFVGAGVTGLLRRLVRRRAEQPPGVGLDVVGVVDVADRRADRAGRRVDHERRAPQRLQADRRRAEPLRDDVGPRAGRIDDDRRRPHGALRPAACHRRRPAPTHRSTGGAGCGPVPPALAQAAQVELVQRRARRSPSHRVPAPPAPPRPGAAAAARVQLSSASSSCDVRDEYPYRAYSCSAASSRPGRRDVQHRQRRQHAALLEEGAAGRRQGADRRPAVALQEHRRRAAGGVIRERGLHLEQRARAGAPPARTPIDTPAIPPPMTMTSKSP